jgi:Type IV secretion-system coupling protein DNA-binding domain
VELNSLAGRQSVFADNQVRPYYHLGRVPITFEDGQASNLVCIGQQGSGKTATLEYLMSALLPLTKSQLSKIIDRTPNGSIPLPKSMHEWSRSLTHQAVVYNAKQDYIPFLAKLGFNPEGGPNSDLIILDPYDERCFAWDIAKDICDDQSISQFAEILSPDDKSAREEKDAGVWKAYAQMLIEAIIISLINAAEATNQKPTWTLRDLFNAVESPQILENVLQYHDRPEAMVSQFLDLPFSQRDSILLSGRHFLARFSTTAELWRKAAGQGRTISLKEWAKSRPGTVLVLPETPNDTRVYGPLNQALFKTLTNLFLTHEYSSFRDANGNRRFLRRYVVLDELGDAGRLPEIERLLFKGRDFGVNVLAAFQQLSMLRKTYGEDDMKTILGQCGSTVFLKQKDTETQEWMSKYIGEQLIGYPKEAFAHTINQSQSVAHTNTQSQSHTDNASDAVAIGQTANKGTHRGHNTQSSHGPGGFTTGSGKNEGENENVGKSKTNTSTAGSADTVQTGDNLTATVQLGNADTTTDSTDLRKEPVLYPDYFGGLPDPRTTGRIGGVYSIPNAPPWKVEVTFEDLEPELENPQAKDTVEKFVAWKSVKGHLRTSSWNEEDYKRLGVLPPPLVISRRVTVNAPPPHITLQEKLPDLRKEKHSTLNEQKPNKSFPDDFDFEAE